MLAFTTILFQPPNLPRFLPLGGAITGRFSSDADDSTGPANPFAAANVGSSINFPLAGAEIS
jgi:hypothetical protein